MTIIIVPKEHLVSFFFRQNAPANRISKTQQIFRGDNKELSRNFETTQKTMAPIQSLGIWNQLTHNFQKINFTRFGQRKRKPIQEKQTIEQTI